MTFAGTSALIRFHLRLDRARLPIWILGIAFTILGSAASFPRLYPDAQSRQVRAQLMSSPAAVAMSGPRIGLDDYTFGAMLSNEVLGLAAVIVALMAIFTVVRHTRTSEEDGLSELILARPVGRHAPMAAALTISTSASLTVGFISGFGLAALGLDTVDLRGSLLFGASLASVGIIFGAIAAVAVQLTEHARSASGLAGLVLGLSYATRAVGDMSQSNLSWVSPIAWAQRSYPFVANRLWPLVLSLTMTAVLLSIAALLRTRRDLGSGLRTPAPGPANASRLLSGPLGLALRLERTGLIAWTVSMFAFGLMYGTFISQVQTFAENKEIAVMLEAFGPGDTVSAFVALVISLMAIISSVFGVIAVQRCVREESTGHTEMLLSRPVARNSWLTSHLVVALISSALVLLGGGLGLAVSGSIALRDSGFALKVMAGVGSQLAPLSVIAGFALLLVGWTPRAAHAAWIPLAYAMFVSTFGGLLGLPSWTNKLSVFGVVPALPAEPFQFAPIALSALVAGVLVAAGLFGASRRDINSS